MLFELQDKNVVECVLMRYSNTMTQEHTRTSICLSSQVGCAQACSFCATGMLGLTRSLTQAEILEQFVWCCGRIEQLRNVVFMGQGEPLADEVYKNVVQVVKILTSQGRFSLRENRVTVSTVGIVKNLQNIIEVFPNITIALSLHAPTQTIRQRIVPSARKYSLQQLVELIDVYAQVTKKKMLIEYVMLDGINCDENSAHLLGKLLQGREVLLNLIPFNPTLTRAKHVAPSNETIGLFAQIITEQYGLLVTTRKEFGQDISGACGQLASSAKTMKKRRLHLQKMQQQQLQQLGNIQEEDENVEDEPEGPKDNAVTECEEIREEYQVDQKENEIRDLPKGDRGYMIIDDEDYDEDDFVEDGLEGIVSAMGWLQNDEAGEGNEIQIKRDDLIDPTATCGGGDAAEGAGAGDIEDMLTGKKPAAAAPKATGAKPLFVKDINDKDYQEICPLDNIYIQDLCEGNCHCHRTLRHRLVTKDIDENDIYNYSMAVINVGLRLLEEQRVINKKKGETDKARMRRLGGSQAGSGYQDDMLSVNGDAVVGLDNSDNISMQSTMFPSNASVNTRMSAPVSTLRIIPREKDKVARVFLPSSKKEGVEKLEVNDKTWDAGPIIEKRVEEEATATGNSFIEKLEKEKEQQQKQQVVANQANNNQQQQQMIALAAVALLLVALVARRVM